MFEKFTERARQVVVLAHEEARDLQHGYIGTEHVLLGLLREQEGLAARVLESRGVDLGAVRSAVRRMVGVGQEPTPSQVPFTPRAKKVLELALREGLSLGHNYIGTEHILLGLVRETDGVASRILLTFDTDPEEIRRCVIENLGGMTPEMGVVVRAGPHSPSQPIDRSWLDGLAPLLGPLGREISRQLERSPDTGDLLVALCAAADTRASAALRALGVDTEGVVKALEQVRARAAELRDEERELTQRLAEAEIQAEVVDQMRALLGLPLQPLDSG